MDLAGQIGRVLDGDAPSGEISRQVSGETAENPSAKSVALKAPVMRSILSCEDVEMGTLGFDFHGYSRFLQDRGVQRKEADAFAEVTDRFVMGPLHRKAQDVTSLMNEEVATREDIAEVKGEIHSVRQEMQSFRQETRAEFAAVRQEVDGFRQETRSEFAQSRREFKAELGQARQEFKSELSQMRTEFKSDIAQVRLEIQVAQQKAIITVGVMLATAVGILSAVIGLFG